MKLPSFSLPANDGKTYTEKDFASGLFVLYAYPKDNTPGCTQESKDFESMMAKFLEKGAQIFGISKDSIKSHSNFAEKFCLSFPLLSDENKELLEALDIMKEKSLYGKTYLGIDRSTFIIKDGEIIKEWRGVKVPDHVNEVLKSL